MRRLVPIALMALVCVSGSASGSPRQLRVGLVLDDTGVSRTYQRLPLAGLRRAVRELGVHGKVLAPPPSGGWLPSFSSFASQRYDLIIGLGRNQAPDAGAAARRFPGEKFLMVDVAWQELPNRPRNVLGSDWRVEQPAYLAGYLAALMEQRRPGRDVIGTVGGVPIPSVWRYIAGFEAGARKAVPGIRVLRSYSFNFFDPAKCKAVAERQIGKGAGVLFNVAGACGDGTLEAAREHNVFAVGVDVDQSSLGSYVLTSVLKHWDVNVFETIRALVRGRMRTGGDSVWSLRNGGVGLGAFSPRVPRSMIRRVEAIRKQIVAGKLRVPATIT
jgi:basic membrane protein A